MQGEGSLKGRGMEGELGATGFSSVSLGWIKLVEDIFLILVLRCRQVLPSGFAIACSCVLWAIQGFLQCCLAAEAADLAADFCVISSLFPLIQ